MTRFVALVSGKGGVGKTTSTLNLGVALNNLGRDTLLVDANLGTPNLALHLGMLKPKHTLNHFLNKKKNIGDTVHIHESGISFIPSSTSLTEYYKVKDYSISEVFEHLENTVDFVLIDSPSGLNEDVRDVLENTDEAIIVVNPNLSSVMDGLKTIQLAKSCDNIVPGVILNMSNKGKKELTPKEVEDILNIPILGNVKHHIKFRKSLHQKTPLSHAYPRSKMAKEFTKVAKYISMDEE